MNELRLIKFIGGEEILAKYVAQADSAGLAFVVEDAVTLVYQQTEKGVSVGFAPFMPYAKGKIQVTNSAVASYTTDITEQVVSEYNRIFSNIVIAPANSI